MHAVGPGSSPGTDILVLMEEGEERVLEYLEIETLSKFWIETFAIRIGGLKTHLAS